MMRNSSLQDLIPQFNAMSICDVFKLRSKFRVPSVDDDLRQDFENSTYRLTISPSTNNQDREIFIPLVDDDVNEATEGFLLVIRIDEGASDPRDIENAEVIRNGVALVIITDNDGKHANLSQS